MYSKRFSKYLNLNLLLFISNKRKISFFRKHLKCSKDIFSHNGTESNRLYYVLSFFYKLLFENNCSTMRVLQKGFEIYDRWKAGYNVQIITILATPQVWNKYRLKHYWMTRVYKGLYIELESAYHHLFPINVQSVFNMARSKCRV